MSAPVARDSVAARCRRSWSRLGGRGSPSMAARACVPLTRCRSHRSSACRRLMASYCLSSRSKRSAIHSGQRPVRTREDQCRVDHGGSCSDALPASLRSHLADRSGGHRPFRALVQRPPRRRPKPSTEHGRPDELLIGLFGARWGAVVIGPVLQAGASPRCPYLQGRHRAGRHRRCRVKTPMWSMGSSRLGGARTWSRSSPYSPTRYIEADVARALGRRSTGLWDPGAISGHRSPGGIRTGQAAARPRWLR